MMLLNNPTWQWSLDVLALQTLQPLPQERLQLCHGLRPWNYSTQVVLPAGW
jgi:hypothetical protein